VRARARSVRRGWGEIAKRPGPNSDFAAGGVCLSVCDHQCIGAVVRIDVMPNHKCERRGLGAVKKGVQKGRHYTLYCQ